MKKRIISTTIALLVIFVLTSPIPLSQTSFAPTQSLGLPVYQLPSNGEVAIPDSGVVYEEGEPQLFHIVLATGDVVTVTRYPNGRRSLAVRGAEPNESFMIFVVGNDTYVVPQSADLKKLDRTLFNIDYLLREEYYKLDFAPLLVSSTSHSSKDTVTKDPKIKDSVTKIFKSTPTFAAKAKFDKVRALYKELVKKSEVAKIWIDARVHAKLNESLPMIGLPNPNSIWDSGITGEYVKIAIADTGIDPTHPDVGPRIVAAQDFTDDGTIDDLNGHGTHVAAIAAGDATASTSVVDPLGKFKGVAWGANLINAKVLNQYGSGYWDWIIAGIEWSVEQGADVINLSIGGPWTDGNDPLSESVEWAVDQGVVACVAAGNSGQSIGGYWTVESPGSALKAITVGAVDKSSQLADFSSRGPVTGPELRLKPDVLAPGVDIISAHAASAPASDALPNPPGQPQNGPPNYPTFYTWPWSGTSMATPHVTGIAALVLQNHPGWLPWQVKDAIMNNAFHLDGYDVYQEGTGMVSAPAAVMTDVLLDNATYSFGVVTDAAALLSQAYTVYNYGGAQITVDLSVTLIDAATGIDWTAGHASTSALTLVIPATGNGVFNLNLNVAGLPLSLYSGVIVAEVTETGQQLRSVFGFARMNTVTVTKIDMNGNLAAGHWVWQWKLNPTTELDYWLTLNPGWTTDSNGQVVLYHTNGNYNLVTLSVLGRWPNYDPNNPVGSPIATIAEDLSLTGNTATTLDERDTNKVDLDPNKGGQLIAAVRTQLYWQDDNPSHIQWYFWMLSRYPASTESWVSTVSSRWKVAFGFNYYPESDFNYGWVDEWGDVVNTSEWHDLLYASEGVAAPMHFVADYSSIVQKWSPYTINLGPRVGAWRWSFMYSRLFDDPSTGFVPWWYGDTTYMWAMNLEQGRTEYLSPDVWYQPQLEKVWDVPWVWSTSWYWHGPVRSWGAGEQPGERWNAVFSNKLYGWVDPSTGDLEIYGHAIMDTRRHNYHDWGRYPAGTLELQGPGGLIYYDSIDDSFDLWFDPQPAGSYTATIDATSTQQLSTQMTAVYAFSLPESVLPDGWLDIPQVNFDVWWPINRLNSAPAGKHTVGISVMSPSETAMNNVTAWHSTDDGTGWSWVPVNPTVWTNYYEITLPYLSDAYVSLKVQATNTIGNTVTQTTIRAFYVRPSMGGLSDLEGFDSLGSGSMLMVIGDILVNPHGTKPPGVNFQRGRDMTPLGYFSGMLGEDQLTVFDTNPAWVDTTTGRPLVASGVNLMAAIGGPGINAVSYYYETATTTADRAPITFSMDATDYIWTDRNGNDVLAVSKSSCSDPLANSDVFVMQTLRDADNRLVVLFYGTHYYGTWAAGWYFKFFVYPTITDWQNSYYVVRWTDAASGASANFTPDQGDTYQILAQGSPP